MLQSKTAQLKVENSAQTTFRFSQGSLWLDIMLPVKAHNDTQHNSKNVALNITPLDTVRLTVVMLSVVNKPIMLSDALNVIMFRVVAPAEPLLLAAEI